MDVSPAADAGVDSLTGQVGAVLLRRELDGAEQQAADLLDVLPAPPSLEPGKGVRFDAYA